MPANSSESEIECVIPQAYRGRRLDKVLALLLPDYSRSRLQQWLADGTLTVNGRTPARKTPVSGGEHVQLHVPAALGDEPVVAQAMPLAIIHEDDAILVLDKPA